MKNIEVVEEENVNHKFHNYFILVLLFIVCICFVLYLCRLYKINDEEQKKIPVINGLLSEIYSDDLEHYVVDNSSFVIYMCTANDDNCRSFEKNFKKLLKKKNYQDSVIYLNLTGVSQEEFVNDFNNKYNYKINLTTDYPAFIYFEDGEVQSILQGSSEKKLSVTKVKNFLELNNIGE